MVLLASPRRKNRLRHARAPGMLEAKGVRAARLSYASLRSRTDGVCTHRPSLRPRAPLDGTLFKFYMPYGWILATGRPPHIRHQRNLRKEPTLHGPSRGPTQRSLKHRMPFKSFFLVHASFTPFSIASRCW